MIEKISYDEMLVIIEELEDKLMDLNVVLNEIVAEGKSDFNSKAQKLYLDAYGLNNKLLNCPSEAVREVSLEFANSHHAFMDHEVETVRDMVNEFNDKLSSIDVSAEEPVTVKLPDGYEKTDEVIGLPENATAYVRRNGPYKYGPIIIKPYEEREYTLNDDQTLLDNNYGLTTNGNKFVYRFIYSKSKSQMGQTTYQLDLCLTFDDCAFDITAIFAGMSVRFLNIINKWAETGKSMDDLPFDLNASDEVKEQVAMSPDYDEMMPDDILSEARRVLRYIVENN